MKFFRALPVLLLEFYAVEQFFLQFYIVQKGKSLKVLGTM